MSGIHASRETEGEGRKPRLSFSIERILFGDFTTEEERTENRHNPVACNPQSVRKKQIQDEETKKQERYAWLKYTRYNPPKLPKSSKRRMKKKRKPGRNPRVPFTVKQLTTLEAKFQQMKYLSNEDVTILCEKLSLPEHRIKIWFQNRRAREKKKSQTDYIDVVGLEK